MNDYIGKIPIWQSVAKRLSRSIIASAISAILVVLENDPKYIALIPVMQATAKYLREKYGWTWLPV